MQWNDSAIILSSKAFGENGLLVHLFARSHGLYRGMVRKTKQMKSLTQTGCRVSARWNARLDQHLGTFQLEEEVNYAAPILHMPGKLLALISLSSLMECTLPEREENNAIFELCANFLESGLREEHWLEHYVNTEIELLKYLGFALDFSECAATGDTQNLIYVSPKSGRAVSQTAGDPYHSKLLKLPKFLTGNHPPATHEDLIDGFKLAAYFLERQIFASGLPSARARLFDWLVEQEMSGQLQPLRVDAMA